MNILDRIWPWRDMDFEEIERLQLTIDELRRDLAVSKQQTNDANLRYASAKSDVLCLQLQLGNAHFRDPKTGRWCKKGVRP